MTRHPSIESSVNVDQTKVDEFTARLKGAIAIVGSVTNMASRAGVSESVLRKWRSGGSEPQLSALVRIAEAANLNVEWLATGRGPVYRGGAEPESAEQQAATSSPVDEYALIPVYDVQASAGGGLLVESEKESYSLAFRREWIYRELNATPSDLYLIKVAGESMEPTLRPGDTILIDRRMAESGPGDGIHVLRMDDSLLVKRIQRLPGRRLRVTSDNSAYEPFDVELSDLDGEMAVLGRVVWAGRRM